MKKLNYYRGRLDDVPGIFSLMKPLPEAINSFKNLSEKFETYLLSTAPWDNPNAWSNKLLWVKKYIEKLA